MVSSLGCQIFAMKMCLHWIWDLGISVARTIEGDVRSEHPVVMRYLIAGIAITNQRSSVRCVAQNKMFNSTASSAGFAWGITFAPNATSVMMITGGEENFFHCKRCGIQNPNRMLLFNLVEGFTQLCGKSNGSQLPCLL
ncbi:uncharacterized protein LOC110646705 isoform X1 [Hevea brasiliensis]|uniref:uncharacterized protein LOC110646705 isoform X1 n=1 Tax=Hevea brasiliensis TaxID=3981 RepID=UPI0025EAE584|nr:uncharacterized protein LOC110646705 isoform X1 [Hevea brasiliensis]XP_058003454.1 uncharacterized protein LOC110646705 isoform X1 [Hevea brasiliensis]